MSPPAIRTSMLMRNVYDSLVRVEGNPPKPVPHLATSWTVSPDGLEYVFKLDPAAKFHDGSPVTAEDVEYSFKRLLRLNKGNAWMIRASSTQDSVTAVDAQTVRMKLASRSPPSCRSCPGCGSSSKKQVEANSGTDDGQTYLRTNTRRRPARSSVRRAEPGNLYEFERVADGWKKGGGNLTGAIWKIMRETATQRLMLQRGEAHIAVDLTSEDMDALKDRPGVVRVIEPEYRTFSIKMNTRARAARRHRICARRSPTRSTTRRCSTPQATPTMVGPLPNGIFGHDPSAAGLSRPTSTRPRSIWRSRIPERRHQAHHRACVAVSSSSAAGRSSCSTASRS